LTPSVIYAELENTFITRRFRALAHYRCLHYHATQINICLHPYLLKTTASAL